MEILKNYFNLFVVVFFLLIIFISLFVLFVLQIQHKCALFWPNIKHMGTFFFKLTKKGSYFMNSKYGKIQKVVRKFKLNNKLTETEGNEIFPFVTKQSKLFEFVNEKGQ